jgi:hypothetical protein
MKVKALVLLTILQTCSAVHLTINMRDEDSSEWREYRATRGEHDCAVNEN